MEIERERERERETERQRGDETGLKCFPLLVRERLAIGT